MDIDSLTNMSMSSLQSLSQSPLSSPKKKIVLTLSALGVLGVVALVSSGGIPGLSSSVLGGSTCTQESLTANESAYENVESQIETLGEGMVTQEEQIEQWKEKISEHKKDISEKKNDIQATKRSVQSLKSYIAKSCGKKKGPQSVVPKDCPAKTNQLSNEEAKVRKLEESVKNRNESIKKLQVNIRNAQTALNRLQGQISTAENFQAEYEACEEEVSAGGISAPETGGDLPINQPETGGNLPINNTTENDADEPGTPIAPVNPDLNSATSTSENNNIPPLQINNTEIFGGIDTFNGWEIQLKAGRLVGEMLQFRDSNKRTEEGYYSYILTPEQKIIFLEKREEVRKELTLAYNHTVQENQKLIPTLNIFRRINGKEMDLKGIKDSIESTNKEIEAIKKKKKVVPQGLLSRIENQKKKRDDIKKEIDKIKKTVNNINEGQLGKNSSDWELQGRYIQQGITFLDSEIIFGELLK